MPRYQEDNGYVSMLDPNIFQFQQQLLNRKQQQYDAGYSIALDTKDKYSAFDTDPEDVPVRNQALDQFTGNVNELVQSKYNGDWGRASKEVAGLVTKFKQDPVWETMQYAKQQRAMEDELTARFGPSALPFASMRGKSVLGAEGKLLTPEQMRVNVEERLNDYPIMDKIWSELSPRTWSGTSFTTKKLSNGKVINVIVDSKGKEISEDMINKELDNMLNIYRDTDNYDQRIREYTQINGMSIDEAEDKIKQDFLEVGMSKKMRQSDQNVQPYDPSNYTNADEPINPKLGLIPYKQETEDLPGSSDIDKGLKKGLKGKDIPETPGGGYANAILEKARKEMPEPDYHSLIKDKILQWQNVKIKDNNTIDEILKIHNRENPIFFKTEEEAEAYKKKYPLDRHEETMNYLEKRFPTLSKQKREDLYMDVIQAKKDLDRNYNKALGVKTEEIKKRDFGPVPLTYLTPDVTTKEGQVKEKTLNLINDKLNIDDVQILEDEPYTTKDKEKNRKEYASSKINKKPKIKGFAYDPNTGPRFLFETADGSEKSGTITGGDPIYLINLLNEYGYPEAINMMLNEYNVKNNDPVYTGSSFKMKIEGEGSNLWNYLYEGTRDNPKYITVGQMRQLDDEFELYSNIDPELKDNEPYRFADKAEPIRFAVWYDNYRKSKKQ